jgi:hypothetical protein
MLKPVSAHKKMQAQLQSQAQAPSQRPTRRKKKALYRCYIYERLRQKSEEKEHIEIFDTDKFPYEQTGPIVREFHLRKLLKSSDLARLRHQVERAEGEMGISRGCIQNLTRLFNRAYEDSEPELFCGKVTFVGPYPVAHIADSCLSQ